MLLGLTLSIFLALPAVFCVVLLASLLLENTLQTCDSGNKAVNHTNSRSWNLFSGERIDHPCAHIIYTFEGGMLHFWASNFASRELASQESCMLHRFLQPSTVQPFPCIRVTGSVRAAMLNPGSNSSGPPLLNVVQQTLWPAHTSVPSKACFEHLLTDIHDEPGSWGASTPTDAAAGLSRHVAHTMQVGRILRPVPTSSSLRSQQVNLNKISMPVHKPLAV